MKALIVSFLLFFFHLPCKGQSIDGVWILTNSERCIEFDANLKRMNIDNWFEENWRMGNQKFTFKINGNKLQITWYYDGKTIYIYKINYLQNARLGMSIIKKGDGAIEPLMGGDELEFIKSDTCSSCQEYYLKKFGTFHRNE